MSSNARISDRYMRVLEAVTDEPERVTDIYKRWAELPEWKDLTTRHRNERKWMGKALENLAADGYVVRIVKAATTFQLSSAGKQAISAAQILES